MGTTPELSIIIPVRNGEKFLKESVESCVLQETDFDFEILVVDDNSTDQSCEIVSKYVVHYPFIRLLKNRRRGVGSALQTGLLNSFGGLIVRLDSDDIMLPGRLQFHFNSFIRNSDLVVQGTQIQFIGEDISNIGSGVYPQSDEQICSFLESGDAFADPSVAFRRKNALAVGGFRNFFNGAEQYDLWMRLSLTGYLENSGETFTQYRVHNNQFTRTRNKRVVTSTILLHFLWFSGFTQLFTIFLIRRKKMPIFHSRIGRLRIPYYSSRYLLHVMIAWFRR
jgi:glycosyltransferase involved in cell wall biosynthesis